MWHWSSIKKALIKRYCKVYLYVIPKFLLVTSFQVCIDFWLSALYGEIKWGCFSYIKQRLHLLQIKIYQKIWNGHLLCLKWCHHTIPSSSNITKYISKTKFGVCVTAQGFSYLILFCAYSWYHVSDTISHHFVLHQS